MLRGGVGEPTADSGGWVRYGPGPWVGDWEDEVSEIICSVRKLTKAYEKKLVLDEVTLAFFHGAKIGVIGHNGSGKSTLLRVLAGEDTDVLGDVIPGKGIKIGYVPQEPELDPELDVRGNIETAVAPIRALLKRYDEINAAWEDPEVLEDADKQAALLEEQGKVQD